MMRPILAASLLALAVAAPVAAQSGTFSLPPNPTPTATGNPNVQGPVDPDRPVLTRPRDPNARPTPAPSATAAPAPTPSPTAASPAARAPARPLPSPSPTIGRVPAPPPARPVTVDTPSPTLTPTPTPSEAATPFALPSAAPAAAASPPPAQPADEDFGFPWLALLGGLAVLGAGAGAFAVLRKRREETAEPPPIEPPLTRQPAAAAEAPADPVVPLMVEAQALKLSRSLMYATLDYELRLANRGRAPLTGIRLGGDLVTAHERVPVDQQLADPAIPLATIQQVAELGPGESAVLTGEIRLPVRQIRPIRQGSAILYVPLLRLRIEADGLAPFARTFVVGKRPAAPGGRLQPFRLDETPQTYRAIAQRALD